MILQYCFSRGLQKFRILARVVTLSSGTCESDCRIVVWQNKWQQGYNVRNELAYLGLSFKPKL